MVFVNYVVHNIFHFGITLKNNILQPTKHQCVTKYVLCNALIFKYIKIATPYQRPTNALLTPY